MHMEFVDRDGKMSVAMHLRKWLGPLLLAHPKHHVSFIITMQIPTSCPNQFIQSSNPSKTNSTFNG